MPDQPTRANGEDIRSTLQLWLDTRRPPAERLVRFEAWLRNLLAEKLVWPPDAHRREKQLNQCAQFVKEFLRELEARGWLFDGRLLHDMITERIEAVAKQQQAGTVRDLYAYLQATMQGYVRTQAEELRSKAISAGYHVSQIAAGVRTLPQIEADRHAETIKEKLTRIRRTTRSSDDAQLKLL